MTSPAFKPFSRCAVLCAASMLLTNAPSFAQTVEKIDENGEHKEIISAIALSPDGKKLISFGYGEIIERDTTSGRIVNGFRYIPSTEGKAPRFILPAIQPDTSRVAYVFEHDKKIRTTDLSTLKVATLKNQGETKYSNELNELRFSPDGKWLFSRTKQDSLFSAESEKEPIKVKVRDTATMEEVKDLSYYSFLGNPYCPVCFVDGGHELFVASYGPNKRQVSVRSLDTTSWRVKKQYPTLNPPTLTPSDLKYDKSLIPEAFSPDGKVLIANESYGDTFAMDTETGHSLARLPVQTYTWGYKPTYRFTPDSKRLLIFGSARYKRFSEGVAVLDTNSWKVIRYINLPGHLDNSPDGAAISPDGSTVYVRSEKSILRFDVNIGKQLSSW